MLRNRKSEVSETVKINDVEINNWENYLQELYQSGEQEGEPLMPRSYDVIITI